MSFDSSSTEATTKMNALSHEPRLPTARHVRVHLKPAREAKVADLELAVGVDEQVPGLEVAVEHSGRVDVLFVRT